MNLESLQHRPTVGKSKAGAFVTITLCLVFAAGLGVWRLGLGQRVEALSAELSTLSGEWRDVSGHLQEVTAARTKFERALAHSSRLAADRVRPRWTPALSHIAMAARERIDLFEIDGRAGPEDPGACEMRVHGSAGGPQPRVAADRFRMAVEARLKRDAGQRPVSTRFDQIEDVPGAHSDQNQAVFVMIATVGSAD